MYSLPPDHYYTSNSYCVNTVEFITAYRPRLIAKGAQVTEILENNRESISSEFSDDVEGLNTCLDFIYDRECSIQLGN